MAHLFTYGSLMFDPVWSLLVKNEYRKSDGVLYGFTRKAVIHEQYPVIFRNRDSDRVEGVLYYDLSDSDFRKLDGFEGEFYRRQHETIVIPGGSEMDAEVYVLKKRFRHIASDHDWSPDRFIREGMSIFIDNYSGFNHG